MWISFIDEELRSANPYDPSLFEEVLPNSSAVHIGPRLALQVKKHVSLLAPLHPRVRARDRSMRNNHVTVLPTAYKNVDLGQDDLPRSRVDRAQANQACVGCWGRRGMFHCGRQNTFGFGGHGIQAHITVPPPPPV